MTRELIDTTPTGGLGLPRWQYELRAAAACLEAEPALTPEYRKSISAMLGRHQSTIQSLSERIDVLDWLGSDTRLSLEHYSPVYCDDDDQSEEWRVIRQSGSINDREYDCVGQGETPLDALINARASLTEGIARNVSS